MIVRLKQGGLIRAILLLAFPKTSWKRLFAIAIFIIIQPIFVNVMASLGGRAAGSKKRKESLARIFHESPAATTDLAVLPGVLRCRPLRRTVQVRLEANPAVPRDGCPARGASACAARGTPIFAVSRQQFIKYPGYFT